MLSTDLPGSRGGAAAARAMGRGGSSEEGADALVLPQEILVTWQETGNNLPLLNGAGEEHKMENV